MPLGVPVGVSGDEVLHAPRQVGLRRTEEEEELSFSGLRFELRPYIVSDPAKPPGQRLIPQVAGSRPVLTSRIGKSITTSNRTPIGTTVAQQPWRCDFSEIRLSEPSDPMANAKDKVKETIHEGYDKIKEATHEVGDKAKEPAMT